MMDHTTGTPAPASKPSRRGIPFFILAPLSTAVLAWLLFTGPRGFNNPAAPAALGILLLCTLAFTGWIANPIPAAAVETPAGVSTARKGSLALAGLALAIPMFALPVIFRAKVLYALPALAVIVLLALRRPVARRELGYALALALAAAVAGLGAGWIRDVPPLTWAAMQVALVALGLLCGWKIFQHTGLAELGVGRSRFLSDGPLSALRGFGLGVLMSLPWAITNILLGGAQDTWVKAWWQPLIALQPGIAEEAWGRVLMVSLLFLAFRRFARPRAAFTAALFLAAYWFAYLHTQMGPAGLVSTVLLGTLYALPISYLCLYRDLETAIGFHFFIDFVRFLAAFLALRAGM
jgi:hypothetical protein